LKIILGSIFSIYHSTPIFFCTTGVGGKATSTTRRFWFGENLWKSEQNLWKP